MAPHLAMVASLANRYEALGHRAFAARMRRGGDSDLRSGLVERAWRLLEVDEADVAGALRALDGTIRAVHSGEFA